MAGNHPVTSCGLAVSSPPPRMGTDVQGNHGSMAVQAGGNAVGVEYVLPEGEPPTHPSREGRSGPWEAILSFFGVRKAAPAHKRPASLELQPNFNMPPTQEQVEAIAVEAVPIFEAEPTNPFPFLELPFELLCEVIARVPADARHLHRGGAPLGTTCKAFHAAISSVSTMAPYRDEDFIARRVIGMTQGGQVQPMIASLVNATPRVREWALSGIVAMTGGMTEMGRRTQLTGALDNAMQHSSMWGLEVMRHLARKLPDTDSDLLALLVDRAVQFNAQNDDESLAKARVLAQLAQRISPNDLAGTLRRWELMYQSVLAHPQDVDVLTVRGLRAGFDHLTCTFRCDFNVESRGMLLCRLLSLYRQVDSPQTARFMAACTNEELRLRQPPEPLPGTVKPHDPMRAYSSIMARPIPTIERLPSHIS